MYSPGYLRTSWRANSDRQFAIKPRIMAWRWPERSPLVQDPVVVPPFSDDSPIFLKAMIGILVIGKQI